MMRLRSTCSFELQTELRLHVLPGFQDNYFYILENQSTTHCAVVDPGDGMSIREFIVARGLNLSHILLTHHHRDHTGGVNALIQRWPQAKIICSAWMSTPVTWPTANIEQLHSDGHASKTLLGHEVTAIDVRGHTLDHIAFVFLDTQNPHQPKDVFVGDALFGAGCGGLFEGTYAQMFEALARLRQLPPSVRLWCAHEYTLKNLRVAVQLGEQNQPQSRRLADLEQEHLRSGVAEHELMTIPLVMSQEIATNPFLRWDQPSLQKAVDTTGDLETFTHVRQFRDRF